MRPAEPDRILRAVGRRVAELRQAAGLTQEEFAEMAKVSIKYAQRIEAGRENLTVRSLVKLANLLGASVIEFFVPPRKPSSAIGRPRIRR